MLGKRVLKGQGLMHAGDSLDDLHIGTDEISFHASQPVKYANVPCCECGTLIQPNPSMMCIQCLQAKEDVTGGISRQVVLPHCSECERYQGPPWLRCEWESQALMALCLKKVRGLNKVNVVHSQFIWTEPHSKRIKIKVTVQKHLEGAGNALLEQSFTIEFHIHNNQCEECKLTYTPHTWNTQVQIRQRVEHKRTMLVLEQLIIKHEAHEKVINIVERKDGLDFQFSNIQNANRFIDFVQSYYPTRNRESKTLISHNETTNIAHQKFTIFMELAPICKDDIAFIPPKVCTIFGGICPLMFVHKVSSFIHLIDPFTLKCVNIPGMVFWQHPFHSILTRRHLSEFFIVDVEMKDSSLESISNPKKIGNGSNASMMNGKRKAKSKNYQADLDFDTQLDEKLKQKLKSLQGLNVNFGGSLTDRPPNGSMCSAVTKNTRNAAGQYIMPKFKLATITVARMLPSGVPVDEKIEVTSHLGAILKAGDIAAGYDLRSLNLSGKDDEELDMGKVPYDIILVKKIYKNRGDRAAKRNWTLRRLNKEEGDRMDAKVRLQEQADIEDLKAELEEDPEQRRDFNLYKSAAPAGGDMDMDMEDNSAMKKIKRAAAKRAMKDGSGAVGGLGGGFGNDKVEGVSDDDDDDVPLVELCELLDGMKVDNGRLEQIDEGDEDEEQ